MTGKHEGPLDKADWKDVKLDTDVEASAHRAANWRSKLHSPTFISRAVTPKKNLRRTAWLDGLRGFAAFLVYWHHHQLWAHDAISANSIFENQFGYDGKYYFACLPGVRTFFTGGHYSVTVFFVISGYVLSTKPMSLIQNAEYTKLGDNISSALFRRWLRLFLPVIATTFCFMTITHFFGIWTAAYEHEKRYLDEVWRWYSEFKNFSFIFKQGGDPWFTYNFHTWSIPVEFKGSIVIYTALMAFSRCRRNARLWCQVGLIFYFMYIADGWYCALFVSGMLLCDLDMLAAKDQLPNAFEKLEPYKDLIYYHLLIISIYLGGVPSQNMDMTILRKSRGWYYLSLLKPQAVFDYKWFYLFWAASFLIAAIPRIKWLKGFFETPFSQYLGRISFALYLMHGPVLWTLGDRVYAAVGYSREPSLSHLAGYFNIFPLPAAGPLGLEVRFLLPHMILLPTTFWFAELVTRAFDTPSNNFVQWLYGKTLPPPPPTAISPP
ncbi:MAG: hypothetical protein M1820_001728 [Bogoriella megaspora]|nr:MAG: hypothetical protein M1820_001728 [Bogoriella megaspora]